MHRNISILSIDYSGASTGLTFGRPGEIPLMWTERFATGDYYTLGQVASAAMRWIDGALVTFKPDLVLIEAALHNSAQSGDASARMNLGGAFVINGACYTRSVRCIETKIDDWKKFAHGTARLRRDEGKQRSKEICRAFGLQPKNDDEADSFCLWLYGMYKYADFYTPQIQQVLAKAQRRLVA